MMISGIGCAPVTDFAQIDPVAEHLIERPATEVRIPHRAAVTPRPLLGPDILLCQFGLKGIDRSELQIATEDMPDSVCLSRHDDQLARVDTIPQRHYSAHPHTSCLGGS